MISKHNKRFNFKEGKLDDHMVFYIDIETTLDEDNVVQFIERFKRQLSQATMIPMEYFGIEIEKITDD